MASPEGAGTLSELAKQEMVKLAEAAVNEVLEPQAQATAPAAARTSDMKAPAASKVPLERKNLQLPSPGSTPGPEPPAMTQPSPNELADKIACEVPEADPVEEVAEAAPTFRPVVTHAQQNAYGASEDDNAESFSDILERPMEAAEEPPRSSSAVGSPAITAHAASPSRSAAAAVSAQVAHALFPDAAEAPAEAADETSPVAAPSPSLTSKAASSISHPAAAVVAAIPAMLHPTAAAATGQAHPSPSPSPSLPATAAPSQSRSAAAAAAAEPDVLFESAGDLALPPPPAGPSASASAAAPSPALSRAAAPAAAAATFASAASASTPEPEILEILEEDTPPKHIPQPATDDSDDDAQSEPDSPPTDSPAAPGAAAAAPSLPTPASSAAAAASSSASAAVNLKELPKVAADAARQAGQAYVEAGRQAGLTLLELLSLRHKEGPPVTLTADQVATAGFLVLAGSHLLLLTLFAPSTFRLLYSLFWGLCVGLGLSYLFYYNRKRKQEANELLATNLGLKGVQLVAAGIPAVFNMAEEEKMEWLNALVAEVWPFVDKGVCQMIKDMTAQMMPGVLAGLPGLLEGKVRSVSFKHLTFGAAPMRVESIKVNKESDNGVVLELSVKWCGDPNITLAIEIPGGQKLCPRVLDISFAAKVRLVLKPLVARLPGFVAAMATVPKPPLIKYRLDFGKALGGSVAPMAVTPVVNYFLRGMLDRLLVWPNRIVVPILQETASDAAEVQKLMRRVRGMVRVCVLRGKGLRGVEPSEPAVVELTTDTEYYESTRPRSAVRPEELAAVDGRLDRLANTEVIAWGDFMYLLVQEPESQMVRLETFELPSGRAGKAVAAVAGGRRFVGRALVKLNRVCRAAAEGSHEPVPVRVQLGKKEWGSAGGPGKGAGQITLSMSYFPCEDFTQEQVLSTEVGIITVRLLAIGGLSPSAAGTVTAYASFAMSGAASKRDGSASRSSSASSSGSSSWKSAKKYWTLASHVAQLRARIAKLEAARQRDLREGDSAEAEAKAAELRQLRAEVEGADDKAAVTNRRVTLDFSMETAALTAFYRVTEKIETRVPAQGGEGGGGGGVVKNGRTSSKRHQGPGFEEEERVVVEDNCVVIKVVQEGRVKRAAETLGEARVPVSLIKNGCCLNPLSGKKEYGLYLPKWKGYDPDAPGSNPPESEWGYPLEGSAGVRVWAVMRWVPCVQAVARDLEDDDEAAFVNALPSVVSPVQSA